MLAKLNACPADVTTARDYLPYAQARVEPVVWSYLQEGSGDGLTLAANRRAFDELTLMPRPLRDVAAGNTRCSLFGQQYQHPMLLAPIAYQTLFHAMGECGSALAANAQGGNMLVSSLASQTLEQIIDTAQQPLWFQLYWQGDRERTLRLLQRALAAGYQVVVLTIDAPVKQAVLSLPVQVQAVNLQQPLTMTPCQAEQSMVFHGWMSQAPTWEDVAWLREQCSVPLLLKGILHPDDALRAVSMGMDGLIVSNHGGRVLDGAPASLTALQQVIAVLPASVPVLLDSGIMHGRDVFKALQLGAKAVLIGRPYIWGLASCGALGVAHVLRLMRDELELTMALTGCVNLQEVYCGK